MSNFTGVTFAQQKVLPSDDAIIRRSILSDGVLHGCELSYSGSTLTMGAGQLLICGRQIRHPSAQNWAVTDATSGFARLVLTVDLTRTASKEVFDQVVESIQYATSQDGFPYLNQTNINTFGSVYQIAVCTVSLGAGGITGIVDQIGPCEAVGGGGLNFKVVGGSTQPADPSENTIWVNTDIPVSSYAFQTLAPDDPDEGMLWIITGTSSSISFNVLKKNSVVVYPISAKQYVGGEWRNASAYIYQAGKWIEFSKTFDGYLFNNGSVNEDITGGWVPRDSLAAVGEVLSGYEGNVPSQYAGTCSTANKIDLTDYKTVKANRTGGNGTMALYLGESVNSGPYVISTTTGELSLDVSDLVGEYHISLTSGPNSRYTVDIVKLE